MAAKELNDRFGLLDGDVGLKVLVFLRTDIYAALRFDDKDKHRATEQPLTWTSDELHEVVARRLPTGVTVEQIFEPGEMRGRTAPFEYIVKRTFLRPREVIQFLDECVRRSPSGASYISKDGIREAENQYSRWKIEDLKQEFARIYPELGEMLEVLQQEYHRYDSMDDLITVIRRKKPDLLEQHSERELLEILFETSVIGFRLRDSGAVRYKSEDIDLFLPAEAAVYVHQGLRKGLNIVERRSPGNRDENDAAAEDEEEDVEIS
jgi:hypothetical protein